MPIYAYRCTACGHAQDVLQKMSDPLLTVCPACGAATYAKQLTAAGFQLKGSGWYVTDFRDGGGSKGPGGDDKSKPKPADNAADGTPAKTADKPAEAAAQKPADKPADKPAPASPAASPTPPASGS
jgi:putative FmdB family regulatory protein